MSSVPGKKLTRSSKHKMIAGVCGGLAEYFGMDPTVVRVAYVLISIVSAAFPGILAYIVLMFVLPPPEETSPPSATPPPTAPIA
jgi:phage shock protein C